MEEYNLFSKLNNLKFDIENDLRVLDKVICELKTTSYYETHREINLNLEQKCKEYWDDLSSLEKRNSELQNDLNEKEKLLSGKEQDFNKTKLKMKELLEDNRSLEISLSNLKGKAYIVIKYNSCIEVYSPHYLLFQLLTDKIYIIMLII